MNETNDDEIMRDFRNQGLVFLQKNQILISKVPHYFVVVGFVAFVLSILKGGRNPSQMSPYALPPDRAEYTRE